MRDDHRRRRDRAVAAGILGAALLGLATARAGAQAADETLDGQASRFVSAVTECYAAARDADAAEGCMGRATEACIAAIGADGATPALAFCGQVEAEAWDGPLNEAYQALVVQAKEADAHYRTIDGLEGFAVEEESLRAAQRAWLAFRQAECDYAYARQGSGSLRGIVHPGCLASFTARRTIELRRYGEEGI